VTFSKLRFVTQVTVKRMVKNQITKMTLDYLITCKINKSTQTEKRDISLEKHFQKLKKFHLKALNLKAK
jgi:hypothetical protein